MAGAPNTKRISLNGIVYSNKQKLDHMHLSLCFGLFKFSLLFGYLHMHVSLVIALYKWTCLWLILKTNICFLVLLHASTLDFTYFDTKWQLRFFVDLKNFVKISLCVIGIFISYIWSADFDLYKLKRQVASRLNL